MIHYISNSGDGTAKVYGFKPEGVECREMSDEEFKSFKHPKTSEGDLFLMLRSARDTRLADTDKMLLPDYPITSGALEQVKIYRSALRDLPDQPGAPWDGGGELTPWPTKPEV